MFPVDLSLGLFEIAQACAVLLFGLSYVVGVLRHPSDDERTDVEQAVQAYREGYICEAELDDRLELALDPEAERIRVATEAINGIGPATSADLALAFGSLEELREADRSELTRIHGIGSSTADAVKENLTNR